MEAVDHWMGNLRRPWCPPCSLLQAGQVSGGTCVGYLSGGHVAVRGALDVTQHMGGHEDAGLSDMPHPGVSEVVPAPRTGRGLCSPAFRHCAGTV